jgi:hypothetical protein
MVRMSSRARASSIIASLPFLSSLALALPP